MSTPGVTSTKSVSGSVSVPSGFLRSGVAVAPGPGAVPSSVHTFVSERFQNSRRFTGLGSFTAWPRNATDPPCVERSSQFAGFGSVAYSREENRFSPCAA